MSGCSSGDGDPAGAGSAVSSFDASSGPSVVLSASGYDQQFHIVACAFAGRSSLRLDGSVGSLALKVEVVDGAGAVSVAGTPAGKELQGSIGSLEVLGNGEFRAEGVVGSGDAAGEPLLLSGACSG